MNKFKEILGNGKLPFKYNIISKLIYLGIIFSCSSVAFAEDIQFNTDVLDVKDRANIDLSHFTHVGYIMPGTYSMVVRVNKTELPTTSITFLASENDKNDSTPCLTADIVKQLGLKEGSFKKLTWWHNGQCVAMESIPGMTANGDLSQSALYISIPQIYMEYSSDTWDPPSRWDNGVPGLLFDYNINVDKNDSNDGESTQDISGTGTAGANLGPWRLRADWQYQNNTSDEQSSEDTKALQWTRYYLYRALPSIQSKLTMGQNTMASQLFDNFQYMGVNVATDDSMIPPNMRGYAPEINGVANSNAKVTVSQQGRILYETRVAAGPFSIQELSDSVSGKLDVKVEEQNGDIRTWQVDTASIPYLSRPGSVRYSLTAGRPTDWNRNPQGPIFSSGELSWGITNGWSLYGGILASNGYQAASLGVGRDLLSLGAVSVDVTQSHASLTDGEDRSGRSYRLSYSKRFDDYDSEITFAGYRFSEKTYMSMSQYLDSLTDDVSNNYGSGADKEMYTITLNKQFKDLGFNINLSYGHQTYWDRAPNENWNLAIARYFDVGDWKNINVSLNGYSNSNYGQRDKGMYLSVSVPIGENNTLSYNGATGDNASQSLGWSSRLGSNDSVQINAGKGSYGEGEFSGYYTHEGDIAKSTVSGSYQQGIYSSVGLSATGGVTLTPYGTALHRVNVPGGTRLMLDTEGVSGVPVSGNGSPVKSNIFGKAVVSDVNSYYRNTAQVNVSDLDDDVEAVTSVVQDTLTEGAIGYKVFEVVAGHKLMGVIKQPDGSAPPFGAIVKKNGHQTGIVGDNGEVWLSGVEPNGQMNVSWDDGDQCRISFPPVLPVDGISAATLLLPCAP